MVLNTCDTFCCFCLHSSVDYFTIVNIRNNIFLITNINNKNILYNSKITLELYEIVKMNKIHDDLLICIDCANYYKIIPLVIVCDLCNSKYSCNYEYYLNIDTATEDCSSTVVTKNNCLHIYSGFGSIYNDSIYKINNNDSQLLQNNIVCDNCISYLLVTNKIKLDN